MIIKYKYRSHFFHFLLAVVLSLLLNSCSSRHLEKIEVESIIKAEIKKGLYDTISVKLSENQIKQFTEIINNGEQAELAKAMPKYWIFIQFKSDSVKHFKLLDNYIGDGDLYISSNKVKLFEDLYEKNNKTKQTISIR